MKIKSLIIVFIAIIAFSCQNNKSEELQKNLLPQITNAYKAGDWNKVILLTDSLRHSGISYTDYIGNDGFDMAYCEALIATNKANNAIDEIQNHIKNINSKDFYAYHTLGDAYMALNDTINAIKSYSKSVEIRPTYARPYLKLGRIYANKDKKLSQDNYAATIQLLGDNELYDDVLTIGFEALDVDSTNVIVLKYMGDACFAKDDISNAKVFYQTVLRDAASNGTTVPQVFFESSFHLAYLEYLERNFQDAYSFLEVIYANENGFDKNSSSILFGAYVLGAAATHFMNEPIVSTKLLDLAKEIDSETAMHDYDHFLDILNSSQK